MTTQIRNSAASGAPPTGTTVMPMRDDCSGTSGCGPEAKDSLPVSGGVSPGGPPPPGSSPGTLSGCGSGGLGHNGELPLRRGRKRRARP